MAQVRAFERADIERVVDLHPRAFEDSSRPPARYFERVFFEHPWTDADVPSWVHEESDGRITGFLGVVPRRFLWKKRPVWVAVTSQFMVDPACTSPAAGLQLLRHYAEGPQHLSIADAANDAGRNAWLGIRSETIWANALVWRRALRPKPSRRLDSMLSRRGLGSTRALGRGLDWLGERGPGRRLRPAEPETPVEEIDAASMLEAWPEISRRQSLRPDYDLASLEWQLARARAKTGAGALRAIGLRAPSQGWLGWVVYLLQPGGESRVLQLAARPNAAGAVLDAACWDAWQREASALYGAVETRLLAELGGHRELSYVLPRFWMQARSSDPEILAALHRGRAFFSALDGEWVLGHHGEALD